MKLLEKYRRLKWLLKLDLWVIRGVEISSGAPLTFSFAGSEVYKNYLAPRVLAETYQETYLGRHWVFTNKMQELARRHQCAFAIFEVWKERGIFFRQGQAFQFKIPVWLRIDMDLTRGVEGIQKKKLKKMLRVIRNNNLESFVSRERADFDKFYYELYLPYIRKKHGSGAIISEYCELLKKFEENCELLFVRHDGAIAAASLIDYSEPAPHMLYCGIKDGDDKLLTLGAMDALYYFAFKRIRERGAIRANLGNCRAFVRDGVLRAKLELGAHIEKFYEMSGFLNCRFFLLNDAVRGFLSRNPFISYDAKLGYRACAFIGSGTELLTERGGQLLRDCAHDSLSGTNIYAFEDWDRTDVVLFVNSEPSLRIYPASDIFKPTETLALPTAPWRESKVTVHTH